MIPRKLRLLNLDDEHDLRKDFLESYFEVVRIRDLDDAQRAMMRAQKSTATASSVDILLIDINMRENFLSHGNEFNWGNQDPGIVPYGPLLALPFLNLQPFSQFVPYSAYWDHPDVNKNGYVLTALALIIAAVKQQAIDLKEVDKDIRRRVAQREDLKNAVTALERAALPDFRRQVTEAAKRKEIILHDVRPVVTALRDITAMTENFSVPLLVPGGDEPLSIDWAYQDGEAEKIEMSSMFADILQFRERPTRSGLERIISTLEKWEEICSSTQAMDEEDLYVSALSVLEECFEHSGDDDVLLHSTNSHKLVISKGGDPYRLRRIVMLFGWVIAWHDKKFLYRDDLFQTIRHLFQRSETQKSDTFIHRYKTYLGHKRKIVSYDIYRTPFQKADPEKSTFVVDSYSLTADAPAFLLPSDMRLCQKFAKEDLHKFQKDVMGDDSSPRPWTDNKQQHRPYPQWMVKTDFWNMERGLQRTAKKESSTKETTP